MSHVACHPARPKGEPLAASPVARVFRRPWARRDAAASRFRRAPSSRSAGAWLRAVVDCLIEASSAHETYGRLVKQGVHPSMAIRAAFDLADDRGGPAHRTERKLAAQSAEEQVR